MYHFSEKSKAKLATCHKMLQVLFNTVILFRDCTIVEGHRGRDKQNKAFRNGKSKLKYPDSKHNKKPSLAVDVAPYFPGKGASYNDRQCLYFAGYVMRTAQVLDIPVRCGFDWDGDGDVNDQNFNDGVHFEII